MPSFKMKNILVLLLLLSASNAFSMESDKRQTLVKFLSELRSHYNKVNDYSATMSLENFQNNYQLQKQKIWFKKPGYLLLEQIGPFKTGAVLTIKPSGEIKGHLGGFFSFAVVTLDKNNSNMFGVTNDSALNTDYDKVIDIAMQLVNEVSDYSIKERDNTYVLDTYYENEISHLRLTVDKTSMLIIGLERFVQEKLIHKIQWSDIQTNSNIPADKFNM